VCAEDEDAVEVERIHTVSWGDLITHRHLVWAGNRPSLYLNALPQSKTEMNYSHFK